MLFNLLKNALYYLPLYPAMTVTLIVRASPSPRIVVRDTGPGIPADLLPKLFREFQTSGKAEGTGLGLAFCRRVMQALGGDIQCRSVHGQYTEFTLSFPSAEPAPAVPPPEPAPAQASLAGRTVLVVDDQALNRGIARGMARKMGLRVVEAEHGQQALDLLAGGTVPDVILMDISMPGLDGITATRRLRGMPGAAARVPVLALTANDSTAAQEAARAAGMQGVLCKPIDAAALQQALAGVLLAEPTAAPAVGGAPVLNLRRMDDIERLGLLHELLPGALADMRRHLQGLAQAGADTEAATQALHALVGLAGEGGAQALHETARRHYSALLDGQQLDAACVAQLRELLAATEEALWQRHGVQPAATGAPG